MKPMHMMKPLFEGHQLCRHRFLLEALEKTSRWAAKSLGFGDVQNHEWFEPFWWLEQSCTIVILSFWWFGVGGGSVQRWRWLHRSNHVCLMSEESNHDSYPTLKDLVAESSWVCVEIGGPQKFLKTTSSIRAPSKNHSLLDLVLHLGLLMYLGPGERVDVAASRRTVRGYSVCMTHVCNTQF